MLQCVFFASVKDVNYVLAENQSHWACHSLSDILCGGVYIAPFYPMVDFI